MNPRAVALIPVRLESSRLPKKALVDIHGLPMIVHVYRRTCLAKSVSDVFVATDSDEIRTLIEGHGGRVIMTKSTHPTGTDRIAEAAATLDCDIVVDVQGDEALVRPEHIDVTVDTIRSDPSIQATLLVTPFKKYGSTSDIKVVTNDRGDIMYLSRADVPSAARTPSPPMLKGYHVLGFRKSFLLQFAAWPPGRLETIEYVEHLRILEHGVPFRAIPVDSAAISVDTPDDLEYVRAQMARDDLYPLYKAR